MMASWGEIVGTSLGSLDCFYVDEPMFYTGIHGVLIGMVAAAGVLFARTSRLGVIS
jgi:hypothetical protein